MKNMQKKSKTNSKNSESDSSDQVKLREHTAFKNSHKDNGKERVAVWVKQKTLDYERELHDLQIELMISKSWPG
jgi:hypothetical protein